MISNVIAAHPSLKIAARDVFVSSFYHVLFLCFFRALDALAMTTEKGATHIYDSGLFFLIHSKISTDQRLNAHSQCGSHRSEADGK